MHPEALTETGAKLLPHFKRFGPDFYLVGGTALALQIGHRLSVDFDFFSNQELPRNLLKKVKRVFPAAGVVATINNPEQLNIKIDGVKSTFFWYRYPPVLPLIEYQGIQMASIPEIAVMKAFAIGQRGTFRDYVDMYFLLAENHVTLDRIFELAKKKYPQEFNERLFLEQLVYLEDVPDVPVQFLRDPVDRPHIQTAMEAQIRSFRL